VRVDRTIRDGEELRLGPLYMRAILTPGHTRGCTSWLLNTPAKKVLFACSLTVAGQDLISDPTYPRAAADFRQTFRKLRSVKADVFLNFHPDFFALDRKRAEQLAGKSDAFVDPYELGQQIVRAEHGFEEELKSQRASKKAKR
jgi:metallo-beta-lactamase class B